MTDPVQSTALSTVSAHHSAGATPPNPVTLVADRLQNRWIPALGAGVVLAAALGAAQPAMLYRFRRVDREGAQREVTIIGVFVLPGVGFTTDLAAVRAMAGNRLNSEQGIGQLQVVLDGLVARRDAIAVAEDLVGRVPMEVFERLVATGGTGDAGLAAPRASEGEIQGATAQGSRGNP